MNVEGEPVRLDAEMMGMQGLQSPWLIPSERPAVIDPGPANRAEAVARMIREAGVESLDSIVLTHIHFDHAGGAATLARLNPGARIYVHPRVAGLVVDPSRLNEAVTSVWGPQTETLFGFPESTPLDSVEAVSGGETIDLGGGRSLEVIETPGHTRAHLSFADRSSDSIICGDAVAIQIPGSAAVRPSTPPSDYDRQAMVESMERIRGVGVGRLLLPHFGEAAAGVDETIGAALESLARWHEAFDSMDPNGSDAGRLVERAEGQLDPGVRARFEKVNPGWLNLAGLEGERSRLRR
jgi:glyoxylase-like metal-dependent hydrolase (beta-lactamase superfamily II)